MIYRPQRTAMNIRPRKGNSLYRSVTSLTIAAFFSACSKPTPVEPDLAPLARYELKDIRYFFKTGDRVDTTTLQLKGSSVQNLSTTLSSQQLDEGFSDLAKTSLFIIDQQTQLPTGVDLSKFEASVPHHWYSNGSFDRSIETYPLSSVQQQKPYGFDPEAVLTVKIPPASKIDVSRQIDAYQLSCSFDGVLENTATGQRYNLNGIWKGLLQYSNPKVSLKESTL